MYSLLRDHSLPEPDDETNTSCCCRSLDAGYCSPRFSFENSEAANETSKQDELARLQGTWQLLYAETNGSAAPAKTVRSIRVEIKGDHHSVYVGDKPVVHDVSFDIDPTVSPKTSDDTINEGEDKGKQIHGIYQLDGDTLISCVAKLGHERPKEFAADKGSGHTLRVFMKVET